MMRKKKCPSRITRQIREDDIVVYVLADRYSGHLLLYYGNKLYPPYATETRLRPGRSSVNLYNNPDAVGKSIFFHIIALSCV